MMADGPEWFAPKRYGLGTGLPVAWQGWIVSIVYGAIVIGAATGLKDKPLALAAAVSPATILFLFICARTTRGGWRWRWGEKD
jgi:hypothetical protein